MQDNDSMKYNAASHCAQMQCMASVYTTSESKLWMNSSTCLIDLRGEPSWGVKASRQVAWTGKPGGDWFAVFQYWAASPWAPTEHASCNWATINWARTKARLHSEKWCWLGMALGSVWEKSCDIGWRVICSVDEKLSVHQTFVGWALYSNQICEISHQAFGAQPLEMSDDFSWTLHFVQEVYDGWPVTALLRRQLPAS